MSIKYALTLFVALLLCPLPRARAASFASYVFRSRGPGLSGGDTRSQVAGCPNSNDYLVGAICFSSSNACQLIDVRELFLDIGGFFSDIGCKWRVIDGQHDCLLSTRVTCIPQVPAADQYPVGYSRRTRPPGRRSRFIGVSCNDGYALTRVSCSSGNGSCTHRSKRLLLNDPSKPPIIVREPGDFRRFRVRRSAVCEFFNERRNKRTCTLTISGICVKLPPHEVIS